VASTFTVLSLLFLARPGAAIDLLVYNNSEANVAGSLRHAIQDNLALGGGNTIIFSNAVTGTITLASELVISTNVTIVGPGPEVLTISGNNATRVFNVSGGSVTISGLTIANGQIFTGSGAGINNLGNLSVSNCLFQSNSITSIGGGGAILSGGNTT